MTPDMLIASAATGGFLLGFLLASLRKRATTPMDVFYRAGTDANATVVQIRASNVGDAVAALREISAQ